MARDIARCTAPFILTSQALCYGDGALVITIITAQCSVAQDDNLADNHVHQVGVSLTLFTPLAASSCLGLFCRRVTLDARFRTGTGKLCKLPQ